MTHFMRLAPEPFASIAKGEKTYELRLFDEKRQQIRVGDEIIFSCTAQPDAQLCTRVTELLRFDSFASLYAALPLTRCGYTEDELAKASPADMERYYSPEEQKRYGVLAIGIALKDTAKE